MGEIRKFDTGATRDTSTGKHDYCGFLSPEVLEEFGAYMHKHRHQADGGLRAADNWKKGIPREVYIESLFRHFIHLWKLHQGLEARDEKGNLVTLKDTLGAMLFNVQGYFFEFLKAEKPPKEEAKISEFEQELRRVAEAANINVADITEVECTCRGGQRVWFDGRHFWGYRDKTARQMVSEALCKAAAGCIRVENIVADVDFKGGPTLPHPNA